jgi:hypothetical protein
MSHLIHGITYKRDGEDYILTIHTSTPSLTLRALDCEQGIASLKRGLGIEGDFFISGSSLVVAKAKIIIRLCARKTEKMSASKIAELF